MRYEEIKDWKETDFKRLTGVQPKTFTKMLAVLERELPSFGRPPKLSRADQLLMTLMGLAGVPHTVSYCWLVWSQRSNSLSHHQQG